MKKLGNCGRVLLLLVLACVLTSFPSFAEGRLGGHFGIVIPLATEVDGETTTVSDDFVIGFPMGLSVKLNDRVAFDLELVPVIQDSPQEISLTVHPGAIFSLKNNFAAGVRMAFDIDGDAWGFTPLVARAFPIPNAPVKYFVELDFPIRFLEDELGDDDTSIGIAFHTGIAF